jgi:hypothetical protein
VWALGAQCWNGLRVVVSRLWATKQSASQIRNRGRQRHLLFRSQGINIYNIYHLCYLFCSRFEVISTVNMQTMVIWNLAPCSLVGSYQLAASGSPKYWYLFTKVHGVTPQKTVIFIGYVVSLCLIQYTHLSRKPIRNRAILRS